MGKASWILLWKKLWDWSNWREKKLVWWWATRRRDIHLGWMSSDWGRRCPFSQVKFHQLSLLLCDFGFPFFNGRSLGCETWEAQVFIPCLSRNLNLKKTCGVWEVMEESSYVSNTSTHVPCQGSRESSASTFPESGSPQGPLLSPATWDAERGLCFFKPRKHSSCFPSELILLPRALIFYGGA